MGLTTEPGLLQSRWLFESLDLTPAAPRKKSGAGAAEKRNFGAWLVGAADQPRPKPHSVKLLCEKRVYGARPPGLKQGW